MSELSIKKFHELLVTAISSPPEGHADWCIREAVLHYQLQAQIIRKLRRDNKVLREVVDESKPKIAPTSGVKKGRLKLRAFEKQAIKRVLKHARGSTWLDMPRMDLCLRNGYHMISVEELPYATIDIVNLTIHEEYRARGLLRNLVEFLRSLPEHQEKPIYVESVLIPSDILKWESLGFTVIQSPHIDINPYPSISMYLKWEPSKPPLI